VKQDLALAEQQVVVVKDKASSLVHACDPPSALRVKKQLCGLDVLLEDVREETARVDTKASQARERAENYVKLQKV